MRKVGNYAMLSCMSTVMAFPSKMQLWLSCLLIVMQVEARKKL